MQLRSADFSAGAVIPRPLMAVDCGGANRSPELTWSDAPKGVKSFALVMRDPDAPIAGGFTHWVVYNVSAAAHELSSNAKLAPDQLGNTSLGKPGYYGPCPPPGPAHHYFFTLYALDVARVESGSPLSSDQLETRIEGHVLARAVLEATASRR
ncbi:MAG TPA: YbhB/YbcL family Raf kinase inhibitor-like protein [Candidatus Babeliales bacterium]|nr:YbhB/YbcL family Raf kinase inhibitor-like protein [Candidatus Babeliales bacterium]